MQTKLRYSVPQWCYQAGFPQGAALDFAALKRVGVSAIEIPSDDQIAAVKQTGLEVSSLMAPSLTRGLNRVEHHDDLLPVIEQRIAMAERHDIPYVLVFSGDRQGQSDAEGMRNCTAALQALAPIATRAGVTLLLEMLNSIDHKDYQADRSAYGFAVAGAVDSPAVKTLYDIYHMHRMGDAVLKDVCEHLDMIGHIHIAASPKRDMPRVGGEIDYATLVPAIHAAGYCGHWGLEFLPGPDAVGEFAETIRWFESLIK